MSAIDDETQHEMTVDILKLSKEIKKAIDKFLLEKDEDEYKLILIPTIALALANNLSIVIEVADAATGTKDNKKHLMKIVNAFIDEKPKMERQVYGSH